LAAHNLADQMKRAPIKPLPSQEFLLSVLEYDPETGVLRWLLREPNSRSNVAFNKIVNRLEERRAGGLIETNNGTFYLTVGIKFEGKLRFYLAHRLIWKMVTGEDPTGAVDHEDLDGTNNRWINLREATHGENKWNGKVYRNNKSGFKGVIFVGGGMPWAAYYYARGNRAPRRLGRYPTAESASEAWLAEAKKERGEFMRAA
jgi:hypothetical protein